MKVAFDTSVLVAASVSSHRHAARAQVWLDAVKERRIEGATSVHALAETWATLTAIPVAPPVDAALAERVVDRLAQHISPKSLTWRDYRAALKRCTDRGLRSGSVYDALHLMAAERWGADVMLTFNTSHFERLVDAEGPRVLAPPDPPRVMLP